MNEVLKVVLSMSFSGGIVIILLFLVLLLFGKKLSRQWQYYIWLIAIIRLMIPFAPQKNLMNVLFRSAETAISSRGDLSTESISTGQVQAGKTEFVQLKDAEIKKHNIRSQKTGDEMSDETVAGSGAKTSNEERMQKNISINVVRQYLWLIWILPACILFIKKSIAYVIFMKYIRAGSEDVQDIALLENFGELLRKNRIRSTITLSVSNVVPSPMVIGLFKPRIILPLAEMTALEFEHTILHELIHYKRRDILYKWLTQLTICIHWFNPLSYVLGRTMNRACELSCDEAVIQRLNAQERYAYGDTLLCAAGRGIRYNPPISTTAFSDSKKYLKERLDAIMNFQKRSKATFIITLVLSVIIFVGSAYIGVYAAGERDVAAKSTSRSGSSAESSDVNSAQAPHSVLYKNGEYFILFDNADKNDIPGSTGPDYGITFGAVWSDKTYIGFDSYYINKNLTKKIKKECIHMQNKGWLTQKETNTIIAVASKVQNGDISSSRTDPEEEEYRQWNIQKKKGVYYYKNRRVRILMDIRKDYSFKYFDYVKKGTVDLKIVRDKNDKIIKVKKLSKKKAKKIIIDLT